MRRLLIGAGVVVVVVVVVQQLSRTERGREFWRSVAEHEERLRAELLPDEETLAAARRTRAGRHSLPSLDDADVLPDDGTDYF